jgi:hypothetical protein
MLQWHSQLVVHTMYLFEGIPERFIAELFERIEVMSE